MLTRIAFILLILTATQSTAIAKSLSIGTYNIRNYIGPNYNTNDPYLMRMERTNQGQLIKMLASLRVDLLAVQEIVDAKGLRDLIRRRLPGYQLKLSECGGRGLQKLGFIYKKSRLSLTNFREDDSLNYYKGCNQGVRPAALAEFHDKSNNIKFTAMAVHLKAGGKQRDADQRLKQYHMVAQILRNLRSSNNPNIVVLGDFNTTDYVLRNHNYRNFLNFLSGNALIDSSRRLRCSSYWPGEDNIDNTFFPSLLDHVLISREMRRVFKSHTVKSMAHCRKVSCKAATDATLGTTFKEVSDHCPVVTTLR